MSLPTTWIWKHHRTEQRNDKIPWCTSFSSRDHQIVQTTANRIMEIVPGGKLIDKITTYDEYLESDEMARKRQTYTVQEEDN